MYVNRNLFIISGKYTIKNNLSAEKRSVLTSIIALMQGRKQLRPDFQKPGAMRTADTCLFIVHE
jgi:hypothetical protein